VITSCENRRHAPVAQPAGSAKVSVVLATYNYGRYLAGALESALSQTMSDLEIIVIDDGSTDETKQVMASYLADPRVRYHDTGHHGQPAAKNAGIRLARAPLVAFLDADDLWLPTKLEKQLALFDADLALAVVYSRRILIDEQGRHLQFQEADLRRGNILAAMFRNNFICFSSAVVRRDVLEEVGSFDENLPLAIDYDLWLRIAQRYPFDFVDEPLVKYRTGHASLSRRTEERVKIAARIMDRFLDHHAGRDALDPALVRCAQAETYYEIALAIRSRSRWSALPWYLRAIYAKPSFGLAWQGLMSLPIPEIVRRSLRLALGRPADWAVRPVSEIPVAKNQIPRTKNQIPNSMRM
jgi:glycosyltransferase involved in cell wall biosynthesis